MTVRIAVSRGARTVKEPVRATKVGPLCVHPSWQYPQRFTVTHIATGYAVFSRFESKKKAITAAKKMQELKWNFKTPSAGKKDIASRDACRKIVAEVNTK